MYIHIYMYIYVYIYIYVYTPFSTCINIHVHLYSQTRMKDSCRKECEARKWSRQLFIRLHTLSGFVFLSPSLSLPRIHTDVTGQKWIVMCR